MSSIQKKASKKIWILTVFAVFIAIAMSFVSWLIYAVFSQSYREIKQQYYGVVSKQIVEDIENSIRNGKQIERFYGMDKVFSDMLDIISTDSVPINSAITDIEGNVLYTSYDKSDKAKQYNSLLRVSSSDVSAYTLAMLTFHSSGESSTLTARYSARPFILS